MYAPTCRTASLAQRLARGGAVLHRLHRWAPVPAPRHGFGARGGVPLAQAADAAAGTDHAVELPVTFEGGAGVTRAVSPEEVRFATVHALDVGQRIGGTLCFPPRPDGVATVLRFAACVTEVASSAAEDGALEVRARFERLEFAARAAG